MAKRFIDLVTYYNVPDEVRSVTEKQLWTINYWQTGKLLLDRITEKASGLYDTKLEIRYHPGACAYRDDSVLMYDPGYFAKNTFEPTQRVVLASNKTYVYLFHELVHFYHDLCGSYHPKDPQEEFRTVGLYQPMLEVFSENALRLEAKLPRRPCYYWENRPDINFQYEVERKLRQERNLPEQSAIDPRSEECKF